jgi:Fe-S cluster assembly protein SufD
VSEALALQTRKQEDFRYADLDALAGLWPVAREEIVIVPGGARSLSIVETGEAAVVRHLVITLEDHAEFDLRVLNAGPAYGRIAIDVQLGARTRFTLGAAQLGTGSETLEIVVQVNHAGPDAVSRQTVRSVLGGHAAGTCLGRVAVARGADGTDAEQSVRAMLLSRTATANARPELEIYADDVKCAHGCAVGELDEAALFYLQSRGLPLAQAKQLMLQAFIAEAFAGAPEEERLQALALDRLGTLV